MNKGAIHKEKQNREPLSFLCPNCGKALSYTEQAGERTYRCEKGHSFDLSAKNYVNLLLPHQKHSRDPGDNALMMAGRTAFLNSGYYEKMSTALNQQIVIACSQLEKPQILDAGCGEGYYAQRLTAALEEKGKNPLLYGIDISKHGVKTAAKRCPKGSFAVASIFHLPFGDETVDILYSIFSPLCPEEFARVLRPGAWLFAIYPGPRHLFGLKEILYDCPYENESKDYCLPGLFLKARQRVRYWAEIKGQDNIQGLFSMTPYYYRTPVDGAKRLKEQDILPTELDFWIIGYQKIKDK